jgi:hypothetical protein
VAVAEEAVGDRMPVQAASVEEVAAALPEAALAARVAAAL